ncbi:MULTISPECIES: hypothetical protein [Mycobacterium]|uniref:ESX-1 secretion-associated protein n=1 Tax=Mycobacterium kiyosense TaxID=2871094 RepID=A0A9P3QB96_9MYCO|nr:MULTISPECIES: hypothetical protein [Mycobacterium]BDB42825.1 hypothetical protein IWGMT90018_32710 [Mycobacterium kiyosense]BDE13936.1 hypothetical protein MKCMC460_27960 [Mycobacterium sp. 20KCMC460]GLB84612.1 hypothetical protein SRL2020028_38680 [Mycobacterium kiyosense]GLB91937.1 hypothetical protein SRL2020130_47540 [Mycobacterium kiyosense]GLB97960.1 hypothetical protein SRL2020226_47360 [Mycobacterium kiyosense]
MDELLQVDLDNLHRLGATLAGHADAIAGCKLTVAVAMPGSPVQIAADQVGDGVVKAFGVVGKCVRRMAEASTNAAATYEELDQAFAAQRRLYSDGR